AGTLGGSAWASRRPLVQNQAECLRGPLASVDCGKPSSGFVPHACFCALQTPIQPAMGDALIRHYYACFNERRVAEAVTLFADDAILEHIPFGQVQRGGTGYIRFVESWLAAFANAALTLEHVEQRNHTMCEVYLVATGTHVGVLDVGIYQFKPQG